MNLDVFVGKWCWMRGFCHSWGFVNWCVCLVCAIMLNCLEPVYSVSERAEVSSPCSHTPTDTHTHSHSRSSLPRLPHLSEPELWGAGLKWLQLKARGGGKRQCIQMFWESFHHTPVSVISVERERRPRREGGFGGQGKVWENTVPQCKSLSEWPLERVAAPCCQNGGVGGEKRSLKWLSVSFWNSPVPLCCLYWALQDISLKTNGCGKDLCLLSQMLCLLKTKPQSTTNTSAASRPRITAVIQEGCKISISW